MFAGVRSAQWSRAVAGMRTLALLLVACHTDPGPEPAPPETGPMHTVTLRAPAGVGGLRTAATTPSGEPVVVACSICHGGGDGGLAARNPQGRVVHATISVAHGNLSCFACHDNEVREHLRLADGRLLAFSRTLDLCAQCHGPQKRDYDHGAHGGMEGYWDLRRGPRERNHCLVCHDPHAPTFPVVHPARPPSDREQHE